jgi:hypothetical protein
MKGSTNLPEILYPGLRDLKNAKARSFEFPPRFAQSVAAKFFTPTSS